MEEKEPQEKPTKITDQITDDLYRLIERALRAMTPRSRLYALVKAEMQRRGRWKAEARGKSLPKGFDPRTMPNPKNDKKTTGN